MLKKLLEVHDLKLWYGNVQALFGVDLEIEQGQVVALMGRNGMGKSSTVHAIFGMVKRIKGDIRFDEITIIDTPSHKRAQLGLGLVPEGRRVFASLNVEENLVAAARGDDWDLEKVYNLFPRLRERAAQQSNSLSGGEQQMLAIGRALMTNPKLLVLDEATEGLAPVIRQEIWAAIHTLKNDGLSILIVDKSLKELLTLVDHCVILERGTTVWSGLPSALDQTIADQYLGV